MEYRNPDFNANKVKQYEAVRQPIMAKTYSSDASLFGPESTTSILLFPYYMETQKEEFAPNLCRVLG